MQINSKDFISSHSVVLTRKNVMKISNWYNSVKNFTDISQILLMTKSPGVWARFTLPLDWEKERKHLWFYITSSKCLGLTWGHTTFYFFNCLSILDNLLQEISFWRLRYNPSCLFLHALSAWLPTGTLWLWDQLHDQRSLSF